MRKDHEILCDTDRDLELSGAFLDKSLLFGHGTRHLNANGRSRDEILRIARWVFPYSAKDYPRLVVFSATEHGNGCTSVCIQVAEALAAQQRGTVCLVDASLPSPALHHYFGVGNEYGLSDALLQSGPIRRYVHEVPDKNLWLMSAGSVLSDLYGLASPDKLRTRLMELCSEYTHVLIDAPPVNASADSLLLGEMADGLVLIIEANRTRREVALKAKETLEAAGVKLLGAILNKRTYPIPAVLYKRI